MTKPIWSIDINSALNKELEALLVHILGLIISQDKISSNRLQLNCSDFSHCHWVHNELKIISSTRINWNSHESNHLRNLIAEEICANFQLQRILKTLEAEMGWDFINLTAKQWCCSSGVMRCVIVTSENQTNERFHWNPGVQGLVYISAATSWHHLLSLCRPCDWCAQLFASQSGIEINGARAQPQDWQQFLIIRTSTLTRGFRRECSSHPSLEQSVLLCAFLHSVINFMIFLGYF